MSSATSVATAYVDAWNRRDWSALRETLSDDFTFMGRDGEMRIDGPDAEVAASQSWVAAFPDAVLELQHVHDAGEVAIYEAIGRGTHSGAFMGIAPTGRSVAVPVCNVLTVRNGKIVIGREYLDRLSLVEQLREPNT